MAKGMIPGFKQGTTDPATQLIAKNGGKQPPKKNNAKMPKGKSLPPMKAAPKGGKGKSGYGKPAFGK